MKKLILWLLLAALLTGCTGTPAPDTTPASLQTQPPETTPTQTQPPETTPEETAPQVTLPEVPQGTIADAPGTVSFYVGELAVHCGQKVSVLLEQDVIVEGDLSEVVQPGEYSGGTRLRMPNADGKYEDNLYLIAVNPGEAPVTVADCLIYSLTFNCESGLRFRLDKGDFTTGETAEDAIVAAWGAPAHRQEGKNYVQLVYYRPFSFLQLIIRETGVDQVIAYHSAYLYPELAAKEAPSDYLDGDALLLLSRHMDIAPYVGGNKAAKQDLALSIQVDGKTIELGKKCCEMPDPWRSLYEKATCEVNGHRYVYIQYPDQEGFVFANRAGEVRHSFYDMQLMGIHAFNPNYTNWYYDFSKLRGFDYQGVTHNSTIEDILSILGKPYEVVPASGPNCCFVWLHYEAENRDTLRIKVDPVSNQILELRLEDFLPGIYQ